MSFNRFTGLPNDFVRAGWLRWMTSGALETYALISMLGGGTGEQVRGDLDDAPEELLRILDEFGGLEGVIREHVDLFEEPEEDDEAVSWTQADRLAWWESQAAERGLSVRTPREMAGLMLAVGLVTREGDAGEAQWRPTLAVPLPEDCFTLGREERDREAAFRWSEVHIHAEQAVAAWVFGEEIEQQGFSLSDLAERLDLFVDDARHGLAQFSRRAGVHLTVDPECALPAQWIVLTIDWPALSADTIEIRVGNPEE